MGVTSSFVPVPRDRLAPLIPAPGLGLLRQSLGNQIPWPPVPTSLQQVNDSYCPRASQPPCLGSKWIIRAHYGPPLGHSHHPPPPSSCWLGKGTEEDGPVKRGKKNGNPSEPLRGLGGAKPLQLQPEAASKEHRPSPVCPVWSQQPLWPPSPETWLIPADMCCICKAHT